MFNFHPGIIHVSKDDVYDGNTRFIYWVPIIGDLDLEWRVNVKRFKIVTIFFLKIF